MYPILPLSSLGRRHSDYVTGDGEASTHQLVSRVILKLSTRPTQKRSCEGFCSQVGRARVGHPRGLTSQLFPARYRRASSERGPGPQTIMNKNPPAIAKSL